MASGRVPKRTMTFPGGWGTARDFEPLGLLMLSNIGTPARKTGIHALYMLKHSTVPFCRRILLFTNHGNKKGRSTAVLSYKLGKLSYFSGGPVHFGPIRAGSFVL